MHSYQPYPRLSGFTRTWPDKDIQKAPLWCAEDLRDGNQALATPMSVDKKMKLFQTLLKIGFKDIMIGFPSASQVDFEFARKLIDENHIPEGVYIGILCQMRADLIDASIQGLIGAQNIVFHLYNSTSEQQRRITFNKSREEIIALAILGTRHFIQNKHKMGDTNVIFEYTPESFSSTEPDFALEICNAVIAEWDPKVRGKMIINLPSTVEYSTPNHYADRIEWMSQNLIEREHIILSVHTHNDRGTAVASTELALMAGAERVEGTLFGNGERTGNVDLVTLALNMQTQGIQTGLDFQNLPEIAEIYKKCTGQKIHDRWPYAGELVFTAFSGSHQDAISKGFAKQDMKDGALWDIPYLPINPKDIGRSYEGIIRVNSQSGKGGAAWILKEFGINLERSRLIEFGKIVNKEADRLVRELTPAEIFELFKNFEIDDGRKII